MVDDDEERASLKEIEEILKVLFGEYANCTASSCTVVGGEEIGIKHGKGCANDPEKEVDGG